MIFDPYIMDYSSFRNIAVTIVPGAEEETVKHCLRYHPDKTVSVLRPLSDDAGRVRYRAVHFGISAEDVSVTPSKIHVGHIGSTRTIKCPEGSLMSSPPHKVQKSNRMESTMRRTLFMATDEDNNSRYGMSLFSDEIYLDDIRRWCS